ncbi:hypothetical protein PCASD_04162 [Puccinia coronata f. sp. avenae]|uniref:Cyclin-like domain-containing protein n=1 Tax=Puccinia coronata f. sp. avenae TaxID=200324 RepID=A0A2N5V7X3_9BASI|nr:hypothetical protein PCASD_04162 [Puccinia coronata f. sp. avenae]
MSDYIVPVPSPSAKDRSALGSTVADCSAGRTEQWLWPPHALHCTPSGRLGMAFPEEAHRRARAVNWIVRSSISLQLPQLIIATAAAYLHRFYMRKAIQKYPPRLISATALFLATKVEEVPRKLEHVVREYLAVDEQGHERQGPPTSESSTQEFQLLKQEILYYEDILLRTLCFDLAVDHPYVSLIHSVKSIHDAHSQTRSPEPALAVEMAHRAKAKSITQAAWGFVNDSLMTPLCLIARPELIAAAAFLLAVSHRLSVEPPQDHNSSSLHHSLPENHPNYLNRFLNLPPRSGSSDPVIEEPWWKAFQVESLDEIHQVANTMLDQYQLSVCDYIRERASKLPRFPGPSYLCEPDDRKGPSPSHQLDSRMTGEARWESPAGEQEQDHDQERMRAVSSTPSRARMSDNMDFGTPLESPTPSSPPPLPASREQWQPRDPACPAKRSRSPHSPFSQPDDRPTPKSLKLHHPDQGPRPPSHQPGTFPPPPPPCPLDPPPPPSSDPPPPAAPHAPSLDDSTAKPAEQPVPADQPIPVELQPIPEEQQPIPEEQHIISAEPQPFIPAEQQPILAERKPIPQELPIPQEQLIPAEQPIPEEQQPIPAGPPIIPADQPIATTNPPSDSSLSDMEDGELD